MSQGEAAKARGISVRLLSDAAKIAAKDGPAVPAVPVVREAIRQDIITVSDAAKSKVIGVAQEGQRQALALVEDGTVRTLAAGIGRVLEENSGKGCDHIPETDPPMTLGESATFYTCSVADLRKRLEPGTVDLVVARPPADARLTIFSDLGALANRVLTETGVMVVAVVDTGQLPEVLSRRRKDGPDWIMELSLLFPTPIGTSGEPHWIDIRRVALLVCGMPGAWLAGGEDVIVVPAPSGDFARAVPWNSRMGWCSL